MTSTPPSASAFLRIRRSLRADLAWGARQGAFFAAGFTALGAVGWVLGGPALRADVRAHAAGLAVVYWGGGVASGLAIGACRPALHRRAVALPLGAVIGLLFIAGILAWAEGAGALADRRAWYAAAVAGVPLGAGCAWAMWAQGRRAAGGPNLPAA